MAKKRKVWKSFAFAGLTLTGMNCAYWLLWMMAYPQADHNLWRVRFYLWLAATVAVATVWGWLALGFIRRKERGVLWWLGACSIVVALVCFVIGPIDLGSLGLDIHWKGFH
jgi:hypothetical protein